MDKCIRALDVDRTKLHYAPPYLSAELLALLRPSLLLVGQAADERRRGVHLTSAPVRVVQQRLQRAVNVGSVGLLRGDGSSGK